MIIEKEDIAGLKEKLKEENRKIVFTNGCFDIIHKGHVTYLNEAKSLGDYLIIGVNSDASVKRLKGNDRPVNNRSYCVGMGAEAAPRVGRTSLAAFAPSL